MIAEMAVIHYINKRTKKDKALEGTKWVSHTIIETWRLKNKNIKRTTQSRLGNKYSFIHPSMPAKRKMEITECQIMKWAKPPQEVYAGTKNSVGLITNNSKHMTQHLFI